MGDLRFPAGLFFTILGAVLCVWGLARPELRAPLAEVNVNLDGGIPILLFGGAMLWLARRSS